MFIIRTVGLLEITCCLSHLVCQLTLINFFFSLDLSLIILLLKYNTTVGVGQYSTSIQFKVPRENLLVYGPQSHGIFA
jgi:hypothetical protein